MDNSRENLLVHLRDASASGYTHLPGAAAENGPRRTPQSCLKVLLERTDMYFGVSARGSSLATEARAGCIAWMTMSYIMVVNPMILGRAASQSNPMAAESVMTATAFSSAFGCLAVGLLGDAPLGLMPGMGLNAYFAFGICKTFDVTWEEALSCSFVSGALLLTFALLGVCHWVVSVVLSDHLKKAITVAIGIFQALIGFQVMGLVVSSPDTLVTLGDMKWSNERLYLALAGFLLISVMLVARKLHGALLIGIWVMALCAWILGLEDPPAGILSWPRFDCVGAVSFSAWAPGRGKLPGMIFGSLVLMFVTLFDLAGVQYGLMGMAGLLRNGTVPRSTSIFASAGLATMLGAFLGTSPVIIANESSAGIVEGAKTGLMALVVAGLFFLSAFIGPLLSAVPHVATAVPLVLIGAFMMAPCSRIDWDDLRVAIPSFVTMTVVPFTYSIHTGIIAGILMDLFLAFTSKALKGPPENAEATSTSGSGEGRPKLERSYTSPHMTMTSLANDSKAPAEGLLRRARDEASCT